MMSLDPAAGLLTAIALRMGTIALTLAVVRLPAARHVAFVGSAVASILTGSTAIAVLWGGPVPHGIFVAHPASGFALGFTIDALSAWFLLALSLVAAPIAVFSIGYLRHGGLAARAAFIGAGFNLLTGAVEIVLVADNVIAFLFAWELMTLATAALVATEHEEAGNRRAALLYLVMSHIGTGCLIAAFLTLASMAGSSSFSVLLAGNVVAGSLRDALFVLFFLGFGVKAGIIPLHIWLPEAHPAAPTSISALMSGVLIKTGIYGVMRVCAFGLGTPPLSWGIAVMLLGGLSAALGVLYALMQHDLKRLLAYHSIENVGIILLGLGAGMMGAAYGRGDLAAIGVAASLYHVLNHAVFKALLFLAAGGVVMATGTRQIEQYGGLLRRMPWTGLFFLVGALAISGLPPLNGFASEWLTFQAFLYGFRGSTAPLVHFLFPLGGALLALTTALAAACFVKAFGISFLALPRSQASANAGESTAVMLVPQAFLALSCVALGLFPGVVLQVLTGVTDSLSKVPPSRNLGAGGLLMASGLGSFDRVVPAMLAAALVGGLSLAVLLTSRRAYAVRRVPTWGCGGTLDARSEYTATAFSKPLMVIFRAVYRPARQVEALAEASPYFPREVRYRAQIEPTFERYLYGPIFRGVLGVARAMKVLQAGSLHAYLAYVIVLVVGLVLMVWWRG